jgi:hypothetical protein
MFIWENQFYEIPAAGWFRVYNALSKVVENYIYVSNPKKDEEKNSSRENFDDNEGRDRNKLKIIFSLQIDK